MIDAISEKGAAPQAVRTDCRISAILAVYNSESLVPRTLPPLLAMRERGEVIEVIVVDDGSTDASFSLAKELGARVMASGGQLGPAAARNVAAREAVGDILWFVDADVIIGENAHAAISEGFSDPSVVAVFGSYDDKPPAKNFLSQYKNLVHHYYHQRGRPQARTFWSGCGAVRKEIFMELGGFDAGRYRYPSIEDIELGYRIAGAGGKMRLVQSFQCTHLKVWRLGNLLHTEIFRRAIPWSRLMLEGDGVLDDLNVSVGERVRAVIAFLFACTLLAGISGLVSWMYFLAALLLTLYANRDIARLFYRRNGLPFALGGLLFHQFYYIYSTLAFAWVYLEILRSK